METIKGTVQKIKQDKKGVMLENGSWYSNNFKSELDVNVGDEVEVEYKVNGNFNNFEKVVVLKKGSKPAGKSSTYDPATMLVSYAKDIVVGTSKPMQYALEEVLIAYYRVKQVLASPDEFLMKYEAQITGQNIKTSNEPQEDIAEQIAKEVADKEAKKAK